MPFDQASHDGETQAQAPLRSVDRLPLLRKEIKYLRHDFRCDANADGPPARESRVQPGVVLVSTASVADGTTIALLRMGRSCQMPRSVQRLMLQDIR